MNKYLQHIIRKTNRADNNSLSQCLEKIKMRKLHALKTYLSLIQKRLDL